MFEYTNGFRKAIYWSKKKMQDHALKYSKGFAAMKGYTFWEKDFDGMAYKTMLRQLISKWGIMSVDMQTALEKDQAVIGEDGKVDYVDNRVIDNAVVIKDEYDNNPATNSAVVQEDANGNIIKGG
jgi:recombination protein RecT